MRQKRWISVSKKRQVKKNRHRDFHFHDSDYADRRSREGREFEARVSGVLAMMQDNGKILRFKSHPPGSFEDSDGDDFTVEFVQNCTPHSASFGVTISWESYKQYFKKHPGKECIKMESNYNDEEIEQAALSLVQRIGLPVGPIEPNQP